MQKILILLAVLAMAAFASVGSPTATTPAKKKAPAKKSTPTAVKPAATATAKKPVTTAKPGTTTAAARRPKGPVTTWRTRQTSPSTDRYKEIQEALAARGYMSSEEATGAWGQASADALKKFQAEQTLESTGKINSLSLIALGLGPKHDSISALPVDGNYPQPESGRNQ